MNNPNYALLLSFSVAVFLAVPGRAAAETNAVAETNSAASALLPVTEISLYSSGVGFFERDGQVDGRAQVDLRFKTDDINDLLKSMVVRDSQSGRVASVTYGSRDPLTRTLRSFGIDLTENPTLGQLLNQARGEQVTLQWPTPLTGTILGVEKKKQPVGENKDMDVEYLNLVTDDGFQSIPLAQVQKVRLLNEPFGRGTAPSPHPSGRQPRQGQKDRLHRIRRRRQTRCHRFLRRPDPGLEDQLPAGG